LLQVTLGDGRSLKLCLVQGNQGLWARQAARVRGQYFMGTLLHDGLLDIVPDGYFLLD
jgi:hypothetical protein